MDNETLIKNIVKDLQENAILNEYYVYDIKRAHQIIRKHLIEFNNVGLADVRQQSELFLCGVCGEYRDHEILNEHELMCLHCGHIAKE